MRKIALEEHFGTPELMQLRLDWFKRDNLPLTLPVEEVKRITTLICDTDIRLAEMNKYDIQMQVFLPGSNGIEGISDKNEALAACRRYNDTVYEVIKAQPNRFSAFACIPLQAPELAADELERCVTEYGFLGGGWLSGYVHNCGFIDEEKFHPIFARAEKLGVPFYLHPTETPHACAAIYKDHSELIGPTWSWSVDTATYTLRIIMSGLLDKYPKTSIILGHMGEMLPFIIWRLENRLDIMPSRKRLEKRVRDYFRENISMTTSGNLSNSALRCAIDSFGADRIMFSMDYPFEPMDASCEFIDTAAVTDAERRMICYENAERLLGICGK